MFKYFFRYRLPGLRLVLIWITAVIQMAGCSALNPTPTPTPTPDIPVKEIVERSSDVMLTVDSLHFTIDVTGALDYIDRPPTTALKYVEGDLLRPDKVRGLVKVSSLGVVTEVGMISVAGNTYVTNPINQRWELLPPEWGWFFDPRRPFDQEHGIPGVIPLVPLEKVGVEEIEGRTYYHLTGTAQGEQINWWTAGMTEPGDTPVEVWIDTETFLIYRVNFTEPTSDPERPTQWTITFSNYNQPLDIQTPPVAQ